MDFVKPTIEYSLLWPLLVVLGVACLGVLVEAFLPRERRYVVQSALAFAGLAVALGGAIWVGHGLKTASIGDIVVARGQVGAMGSLTIDGPTVFLWGLILVIGLMGVLLFAERHLDGGVSAFAGQASALPGTEAEREASTRGLEQTEIYPLLMFAVSGMLLFPAANDLITMFVALEVLSLPLYLLSGLARRRRLLSQEAALKYFMLGAFSSGFFIYGAALIYGYAGSMDFQDIGDAIVNSSGNQALLIAGLALLAVGLLFKVGAVPFHAWTPDVYQGAPTPVTAFMAAGTKVAAFGAMMRLFYVAFGNDRWSWQPMMWLVAILTMVVGALLALGQTDIKRLLAYSSVAHTGFILTGLLGVQARGDLGPGQLTATQAVLFYLTSYAFMTVGAFAIVMVVRDGAGETTTLERWRGLGKTSPVVAGTMAFLLLGMAGIPLTSGFVGKWAVFATAWSAGAWPVVVVAVISSAITVWVYVKVIVAMFFDEPIDGHAAVTHPSVLSSTVIGFSAALTLALGVLPGPVLDLVGRAGEFIR